MKIIDEGGTSRKIIGDKYKSDMSLDEIKEKIAQDIKETFPGLKFTIKEKKSGLAGDLIITVEDDEEDVRDRIEKIAEEYRYIEEDIGSDYINTNFYVTVVMKGR
jgi:tRNA(Ser,Leu) C12 N-acetylase TAN1